MKIERDEFTHYEVRDLDKRRSWYFDDLYEARASVSALALKRWQIIAGRDNVVDCSSGEPAEQYALLNWSEYAGRVVPQAYFDTKLEMIGYLARSYETTLDDLPTPMQVWEQANGRWSLIAEGSYCDG